MHANPRSAQMYFVQKTAQCVLRGDLKSQSRLETLYEALGEGAYGQVIKACFLLSADTPHLLPRAISSIHLHSRGRTNSVFYDTLLEIGRRGFRLIPKSIARQIITDFMENTPAGAWFFIPHPFSAPPLTRIEQTAFLTNYEKTELSMNNLRQHLKIIDAFDLEKRPITPNDLFYLPDYSDLALWAMHDCDALKTWEACEAVIMIARPSDVHPLLISEVARARGSQNAPLFLATLRRHMLEQNIQGEFLCGQVRRL